MAYTYGTEEWDNAYREMVEDRLKKESKPYVMGSPEWVASFEELVQADETYKQVAKKWEGSVVIHMLANPPVGLQRDIYVFLDLWHGDCRYAKLVPQDVGRNANFVLTGELERWEAVLNKELDVTKGMMQGKLKLKGSLPTIVRYVKASIRLVELAGEVGSIFFGQLSEEKRAEQIKTLDDLNATFGI
jgi:putative sterol carrier protein